MANNRILMNTLRLSLLIAILVLAAIIASDLLKNMIIPGLTIKQSRIISQGSVTIAATGAAYLILRKVQSTHSGHANELAERKRIEEALTIRTRYERGLSACSTELLNDSSEAIPKALTHLLNASRAHRVSIFENITDPKKGRFARKIFEVRAKGVESELDNPELQQISYRDGFERWERALSGGNYISGSVASFPQSERKILELQAITSILVLPLQVGEEWYGLISFDNIESMQELREDDITLLRTSTEMIGRYFARKWVELALRESEKKYRDIIDNINDIIFTIDENKVITYISPAVQKFGYYPFELIGKQSYEFIHQNEMRKDIKFSQNFIADKEAVPTEFRIMTKSGEIRCIQAFITMIHEGEKQSGWRGVLIDITEQKKAEEFIQNSLHEKEVLLQEIHHRVKNNLQIIMSLINLQIRNLNDTASTNILRDFQGRLRTMSLIHESLYKSDNLAYVDFAEYITIISSEIYNMYVIKPGISIKNDLEHVQLSIKQAIPCGLILNELITNAFKYAFPEKRSGIVSIGLHQRKSEIELSISDDGVGIPDEVDLARTESLGLRLVHLLSVQQLGGIVSLERERGTTFTIKFQKI
jgi:PAS domain S-box-containing protein